MNEYRKEFRDAQRELYWTLPRIAGLFVVGMIVLGAAGWLVSAIFYPARIASRVMDPDKAISNYEFFHDANNSIRARVAQIKGHRMIVAATTDSGELGRLRIELGSMQQSCRDLAAKYNAAATKSNVALFRGREAPESINPSICE